jgi:hypothetical protein
MSGTQSRCIRIHRDTHPILTASHNKMAEAARNRSFMTSRPFPLACLSAFNEADWYRAAEAVVSAASEAWSDVLRRNLTIKHTHQQQPQSRKVLLLEGTYEARCVAPKAKQALRSARVASGASSHGRRNSGASQSQGLSFSCTTIIDSE